MGYKDTCEECQWLEECIRKRSVKYDTESEKWIKQDVNCVKLNFCGKGGIIWHD